MWGNNISILSSSWSYYIVPITLKFIPDHVYSFVIIYLVSLRCHENFVQFNISIGKFPFARWEMKAIENIIWLSVYFSVHWQTKVKEIEWHISSCVPVYAKWMAWHEWQSTFGSKGIQAQIDSASNLWSGKLSVSGGRGGHWQFGSLHFSCTFCWIPWFIELLKACS